MERKVVSGIMLTLLLISMLTLAFNIQPVIAESSEYFWNSGGDFELGSFDSGPIYDQNYSNAPWGSGYWGVQGHTWKKNQSGLFPIHYSRFASNGSTAFLSGYETDGAWGVVKYVQGDVWDSSPPWNTPHPLPTHGKALNLSLDIYREMSWDDYEYDSTRIMYAINVWFKSPELRNNANSSYEKRLVMDLIFYVSGWNDTVQSWEDNDTYSDGTVNPDASFHYQYFIGETPLQEWKNWSIDLAWHIENALSQNWNYSGNIEYAKDTLSLYQMEFLLELLHAKATCKIDNFFLSYSGGKTWTVDDDGPADFSSIQEAINSPMVKDGDTIYVRAGTYYERVLVNKALSLIGENESTTIIDVNLAGNVITVSANDVEIASFTLQNGGPNCGIHISGRQGSNINHNIITNNSKGIWLHLSDDNNIFDNNVLSSGRFGIVLSDKSSNNVISANYVSDSQYEISLIRSHNNTISGNTVSLNDDYGILLTTSSSNNIIYGNTALNNTHGITVSHSSSNIISDNYASNNTYGITLSDSSNNTVSNNIASNNMNSGILLSYTSSNNTISSNTASKNEQGIRLWNSNNNTVSSNSVLENEIGILLWNSSNNKIFHNNLLNNLLQVSSNSNNVWDDTYPSGGNFWSDYIDLDSYCGPNQNIEGSDGIWDHPYVIDANNTDNYPLVKPFKPSNLTVSISLDKYAYHAGDKMYLELNVENPDSVKYLCFAIWVTLPNGSIYHQEEWHWHSVVLPIGLDYSNSAFDIIILPSIPSGTYRWHTAFLERGTHTIIVEDTAEWKFL